MTTNLDQQMNICQECGAKAGYYWNKSSGKIKLCEKHYEELERYVHNKEKSSRTVNAVFTTIQGGDVSNSWECYHGSNCKYCKEANL